MSLIGSESIHITSVTNTRLLLVAYLLYRVAYYLLYRVAYQRTYFVVRCSIYLENLPGTQIKNAAF